MTDSEEGIVYVWASSLWLTGLNRASTSTEHLFNLIDFELERLVQHQHHYHVFFFQRAHRLTVIAKFFEVHCLSLLIFLNLRKTSQFKGDEAITTLVALHWLRPFWMAGLTKSHSASNAAPILSEFCFWELWRDIPFIFKIIYL